MRFIDHLAVKYHIRWFLFQTARCASAAFFAPPAPDVPNPPPGDESLIADVDFATRRGFAKDMVDDVVAAA